MTRGLRLLGGLSTETFLRRYWQRRPLLVRDTGEAAFLDHRELFALAARDDVESRLVVRDGARWTLTHGPITPRVRPRLSQRAWTMLVQGVDLHLDAAHRLLHRFAFLSWARLDDVMVSFATDGGGVGAHVDAYDVFLLQLEGHRRWRVGPVADARWQPDVPLKLLQTFEPAHDWVLGPGDMLYIPPGWGHDGVGVGPRCITASVGFRTPTADEVVREVLSRIADAADDDDAGEAERYRDPRSGTPDARGGTGRIAPALAGFATRHLRRALEPSRIALALGEWLTEPKPRVWFDATTRPAADWRDCGLALDRRSRMLYDERAVYLNGESFVARGVDARLLRRLADHRMLDTAACRGFGHDAQHTIDEWWAAGWVIPAAPSGDETSVQRSSRSTRR